MTNFNEQQLAYWRSQIQKERRDPRHPIVRAYVTPKLEYISKFVSLKGQVKVLDVGAGNGFFSYYFDKLADTTAVDYSDVILQENPIRKKQVMDARDLKFSDGLFDLVFCHALLHHIEKNERHIVVEEMKRVSSRFVVAIEPNRNNPLMALFGIVKKEERGTLDFSRGYLRKLFESAGLRIVAETSFGLLTPNRMPIPKALLPLEGRLFERPLWGGMYNILIARK